MVLRTHSKLFTTGLSSQDKFKCGFGELQRNGGKGVRRNLLREGGRDDAFYKFHGTAKTLFFLEINILSAKLGDVRVIVTQIMAETHV